MGISSVIYTCLSCDDKKPLNTKEMIDHLKNVHHLPNTKGTRTMAIHVDAKDFYESRFHWTFGDVEVLEIEHSTRTKKTQMF